MDALTALEAAIRARIDGTRARPFAVLDFDNTCIVNDVGEATLAFLCRNHLLRCGKLLRSGAQPCDSSYHEQVFRHYHQLLNGGDIRSASLLCAGILAGFKPHEATAVVSAALDAEGTSPGETELYGISIARGLAVRPGLRRLIDFSAANDIQIWIVSASPEIAVRTAMGRFGLVGNLIALRHRLDHAVLTHALDEPHSIAEGKVDCIKRHIDGSWRPLFAVGDSVHDLPMVEYADLHAVVERDNALTQEARRRGWFVLPSS
ncbi:MAG TPA: haloacid dehalogenase-like hydrolase [Pseudolabrys sp.]|nr:haloacid dehalogenase-like hydrolase [Pseudolabrys sp.]